MMLIIATIFITQSPNLKKLIQKKKILLSTGASTLNEISNALKILRIKNKDMTILQCNSAYPTPIKDLNLNILITFKKNK